jgi:hypothetical protein
MDVKCIIKPWLPQLFPFQNTRNITEMEPLDGASRSPRVPNFVDRVDLARSFTKLVLPAHRWQVCVQFPFLARGHGLGHEALEGKLLLLELLGGRVLNLELAHSVAEGLLNLVLLALLQLEGQSGVRDDVLNTGNVRLKLLLGLEALAESLVVGLELLGI